MKKRKYSKKIMRLRLDISKFILCIYFCFLCPNFSITQKIEEDAFNSTIKPLGLKIDNNDSLAGNWSFVIYYNGNIWYVKKSLRRYGDKYLQYGIRGLNWKRKSKIIHSPENILFRAGYYNIDQIIEPDSGMCVVCLGAKYPDKFYEREYFAVRLSDELKKTDTLNILFDFISTGGGFFDLYTNDKPIFFGSYHLDQLVMPNTDNKTVLTYDKKFKNQRSQNGHKWLIISVDNKKSEAMNYAGIIAIMKQRPLVSVNETPILLDKLGFVNFQAHNLNFLFELNSVNIVDFDSIKFDLLISQLDKYPEIKIELIGHTDATGDESQNILLSLSRAQKVGQLLIKNGIESERITYKGQGSVSPIDSNETELGRQRNRRVEVWLN